MHEALGQPLGDGATNQLLEPTGTPRPRNAHTLPAPLNFNRPPCPQDVVQNTIDIGAQAGCSELCHVS